MSYRIELLTQVYENYGAHDWDGKGECPQYWKAKGGYAYQHEIEGGLDTIVSLGGNGIELLVNSLSSKINRNDESFQENVIDWALYGPDELTAEETRIQEYKENGIYYSDDEYQAELKNIKKI